MIKHKNSIKLFLHKEVSATLPSHSEDKKKYIHIIATTFGQSYVLPLIYLPDNIKINQRLDNQMVNISLPPNFLQVNLDALTNVYLFCSLSYIRFSHLNYILTAVALVRVKLELLGDNND